METTLIKQPLTKIIKSTTHSAHIITVKQLLAISSLRIPPYQRPYKWTAKHVHQLIDDILLFKKKSAYRLGTLVLHEHSSETNNGTAIETWLDIVDGQQRTTTILLIAKAICQLKRDEIQELAEDDMADGFEPDLGQLRFRSTISRQNIVQNYAEIQRRVRQDFDASAIRFFYERCELVQVTISDVSEAFQFFDSQNARGKDLEPHDLLKAYHLREMTGIAETERIACIRQWEDLDTAALSTLFTDYLYPVRQWAKGRSARYFTKADVDVFKGISPQPAPSLPFGEIYRTSHYYVDDYNQHAHRNVDGNKLSYPFQLDGILLNGRRFFEFVNHYRNLVDKVCRLENEPGQAEKIGEMLNTYGSRGRTGDQYVRRLYDCCMLYYRDRFGQSELSRATILFFVWAYSLRLKSYAVQLASIDNYALGTEGIAMFKRIREALHPTDILNIALSPLKEIAATKMDEIIKLFRELNYYDGK